MSDLERRSILVTGSHRSGTTWVGKMLAQARNVMYLHEPFNPQNDTPFSGLNVEHWFTHLLNVEHWFTHLTEQNAQPHRQALNRICQLRYPLRKSLGQVDSVNDLLPGLRSYLRVLLYRVREGRPLLKDPLAIFSAEWLAQTYDMQVVVLVRHPAGFAGSLKVRDWNHPFSDFLAQPLLMKNLLSSFEDEIRSFASENRDIIDQAGLLWKMIYSVVNDYRRRHKDWTFIRHEDLAAAPVEQFGQLYDELALPFDQAVREAIQAHSRSQNPGETEEATQLRRDSQSVISNWKNRLSQDEIERVRTITEPIASQFYSDDDW